MQILESSMLGLRSARLVFRSRESPVSVTLFPMVHVGETEFYQSVYEDAFSHDVVLVEGVRSPVVSHLTRSYRWIDHSKLGLVIQPKPRLEDVKARVILADLTTAEFHKEWLKVRFWDRLLILALASVVGVQRRLFASRASLADKMSLEDSMSSEEILSWDPKFAALNHSILDARDHRLIECLTTELEQPTQTKKRVSIVFGAGHMRAVLVELSKRRFYCAEATWQTVFSH